MPRFEKLFVDAEGYIYPDNAGIYAMKSKAEKVKNLRPEEKYRVDVAAANVAGIQLTSEEIADPDRFWSQHRITDKNGINRATVKEDYISLAEKIPAVRDALEQGKSLEELFEDPELGPTAWHYFSDQKMLRAIAGNNYMQLVADGRHRLLAARELQMNIPMEVIAEYTNSLELLDEQDITLEETWDTHGLFW